MPMSQHAVSSLLQSGLWCQISDPVANSIHRNLTPYCFSFGLNSISLSDGVKGGHGDAFSFVGSGDDTIFSSGQ